MLSRFIAKVEGVNIGFWQWAVSFLGVIFIRFFLENLSSPTPSFPATPDTLTLLHYGLFYLTALLLTSLILRIFIPDISAISKFLIFIFPVSWLPPIVDLVTSHGMGSLMAYVFTPRWELLQSFLTLGGPYVLGGITLGIKIELAIILVGVFSYAFVKTKNILKSILAAILSYFGIFFLIALPSFLAVGSTVPSSALFSAFANAHLIDNFVRPTIQYSYLYAVETLFNLGMVHVYYFLDFILLIAWVCIYRPRVVGAFLKNIRPGRIISFIVLITLGAVIASILSGTALFNGVVDWLAFINISIAFICAWLFAVGVNDLEDVDIDKISNSRRPLIEGALSEREVSDGNIFFLIWLLIGGYIGGFWTFFGVVTFTAAYYVYSAHPLRLKQIPILASFLIALASLSATFSGFYFTDINKTVLAFPPRLLLLILIFFTLMLNVKDIKDIEGDRAERITTIPVAFPRHGKEIVGGLFAVAFLIIPIIIGAKILFIPSVIAAVLGYILINAKTYREWPVFIIYFAYILTAALLLWPR
jgi:4-hydroxybenzoate polyprenyltransferase